MSRTFPTSARPLADLVGSLVTPICRRRGVADAALVLDPADLFGTRFARAAAVERIVWPRRDDADGATLVIRADGAAALALQHAAPQVIERANTIIGWPAIARIRISQAAAPRRPAPPSPPPSATDPDEAAAQTAALAADLGDVADPELRQALARLGSAVARRGLSGGRKLP